MNQYELKPNKTNIGDYYSWGKLEKAVVDRNLSNICNRDVSNFPDHFNGFPLRIFMYEEDPVAIGWDKFPKSFTNSKIGELRKFNPLTAGYNGLITGGLIEYLNFTPIFIQPIVESDKYAYKTEEGIIKRSWRSILFKV